MAINQKCLSRLFAFYRAYIETLLWGNAENINYIKEKHEPFDLVIASDVLYDPKNYQNLLSTILQFRNKESFVIFGGTKRHLENQFLKLCSQFYRTSSQDLEASNKYIFHLRSS